VLISLRESSPSPDCFSTNSFPSIATRIVFTIYYSSHSLSEINHTHSSYYPCFICSFHWLIWSFTYHMLLYTSSFVVSIDWYDHLLIICYCILVQLFYDFFIYLSKQLRRRVMSWTKWMYDVHHNYNYDLKLQNLIHVEYHEHRICLYVCVSHNIIYIEVRKGHWIIFLFCFKCYIMYLFIFYFLLYRFLGFVLKVLY